MPKLSHLAEFTWQRVRGLFPNHCNRQEFEEHSLLSFVYSYKPKLCIIEKVVSYKAFIRVDYLMYDLLYM